MENKGDAHYFHPAIYFLICLIPIRGPSWPLSFHHNISKFSSSFFLISRPQNSSQRISKFGPQKTATRDLQSHTTTPQAIRRSSMTDSSPVDAQPPSPTVACYSRPSEMIFLLELHLKCFHVLQVHDVEVSKGPCCYTLK